MNGAHRISLMHQAILVTVGDDEKESVGKEFDFIADLFQEQQSVTGNDLELLMSRVEVLSNFIFLATAVEHSQSPMLVKYFESEFNRHRFVLGPKRYKIRFLKHWRLIKNYSYSTTELDVIPQALTRFGLDPEELNKEHSTEWTISDILQALPEAIKNRKKFED